MLGWLAPKNYPINMPRDEADLFVARASVATAAIYAAFVVFALVILTAIADKCGCF